MKTIIIFVSICLVGLGAFGFQKAPPVTHFADSVQGPQHDKVLIYDKWSQLIRMVGQEYESLEEIRESLLHDPPTVIKSLDRQKKLKEAIQLDENKISVLRDILKLDQE